MDNKKNPPWVRRIWIQGISYSTAVPKKGSHLLLDREIYLLVDILDSGVAIQKIGNFKSQSETSIVSKKDYLFTFKKGKIKQVWPDVFPIIQWTISDRYSADNKKIDSLKGKPSQSSEIYNRQIRFRGDNKKKVKKSKLNRARY